MKNKKKQVPTSFACTRSLTDANEMHNCLRKANTNPATHAGRHECSGILHHQHLIPHIVARYKAITEPLATAVASLRRTHTVTAKGIVQATHTNTLIPDCDVCVRQSDGPSGKQCTKRTSATLSHGREKRMSAGD